MKKKTVVIAIAIICLLLLLRGCIIRVPEIKGVVLDAATRQPVEGAWVRSSMELNTKTVGGDSHSSLTLSVPHTRTDKDGRFTIPSKTLTKPIPPFGFGTEVLSIRVGASTPDDREGVVRYFGGYYKRDFGKGDGDLGRLLWSFGRKIELQIKPVERTEEDYFHHLQSMYNSCISDRDDGCDEWELDYAIRKHERYLYKFPIRVEIRSHQSIILEQLGLLYKGQRKYKNAIENLKKAREIRFFQPQSLDNEIEIIKRLFEHKQE